MDVYMGEEDWMAAQGSTWRQWGAVLRMCGFRVLRLGLIRRGGTVGDLSSWGADEIMDFLVLFIMLRWEVFI